MSPRKCKVEQVVKIFQNEGGRTWQQSVVNHVGGQNRRLARWSRICTAVVHSISSGLDVRICSV